MGSQGCEFKSSSSRAVSTRSWWGGVSTCQHPSSGSRVVELGAWAEKGVGIENLGRGNRPGLECSPPSQVKRLEVGQHSLHSETVSHTSKD